MAHLLAISGLHIALIYGIIYFLLKIFFGLSLKLMERVHCINYGVIDHFISSLA